jgi:hypothetical protein
MKIVIIFFTLVLSICANADEFVDGNDLLSHCKGVVVPSSDPIAKANGLACLGYIEGMKDMHSLYKSAGKATMWCIPENVTNDQIVLVVYKYLQNNPEVLNQYKSILVITALKKGFDCKK